MNIVLDQSAKNILNNKKLPLNFGGIFLENNKYCWWYNNLNNVFDTGEENSLTKCFDI